MTIRKDNNRKAFTLVELMMTVMAALIVILGSGAILINGHIGYNRLFRRVNSEVVRNANEARMTFDSIVRQSTVKRCDLISANELYVYYYSDPANLAIVEPDRYAKFRLSGTELLLNRGNIPSGTTLDTLVPSTLPAGLQTVLASNVAASADGIFQVQGASVRMVLTLDNESAGTGSTLNKLESLKMTVTTTAIRHNK
jgi:hypothetical protein